MALCISLSVLLVCWSVRQTQKAKTIYSSEAAEGYKRKVQQKTTSLPCPQQNNTAVQFDLQLPTQTAEVQFAGRFLDSDSENEYNLLAVEAVESNTGVIDCPDDEIEEYFGVVEVNHLNEVSDRYGNTIGVVEVNHLNEASDRNGDLKKLKAVLRAGNK